MPNFYQGDVVRDYMAVLDDDGNPVLGVTWTVIDTIDPDEDDFSLTITEVGNGIYRAQFFAQKVGSYYFLVETSSALPDPVQTFESDFDIGAANLGGAVIGAEAHGLTLNDLIEMCAVNVGDFLWLQATTAGSGDGTSFVDTLRLAAVPSQGLNGASITVVSPPDSPNYLAERRVSFSAEDSQTLTVTPAFPSQIAEGTVAWVTNLESRGYWRQQYVNAINNAIRVSFPMHLVPLEYTYPGYFVDTDPSVPTPASLTHLYGVQYQNAYDGRWSPLAMTTGNQPGVDPYGWWYDFASGAVWVGRFGAQHLNGLAVKLLGYGRPAPLVNPDDITTVSPTWLVERVSEMLRISKGDQRLLATASMHGNKAELYSGLNVTQVVHGTFKIK